MSRCSSPGTASPARSSSPAPRERTGRDETAAYFRTRPHGSQLGAWASEQSSAVGLAGGAGPDVRGAGRALSGGRGRAGAAAVGRVPGGAGGGGVLAGPGEPAARPAALRPHGDGWAVERLAVERAWRREARAPVRPPWSTTRRGRPGTQNDPLGLVLRAQPVGGPWRRRAPVGRVRRAHGPGDCLGLAGDTGVTTVASALGRSHLTRPGMHHLPDHLLSRVPSTLGSARTAPASEFPGGNDFAESGVCAASRSS